MSSAEPVTPAETVDLTSVKVDERPDLQPNSKKWDGLYKAAQGEMGGLPPSALLHNMSPRHLSLTECSPRRPRSDESAPYVCHPPRPAADQANAQISSGSLI